MRAFHRIDGASRVVDGKAFRGVGGWLRGVGWNETLRLV